MTDREQPTAEPVVKADAIRTVLAALVTVGWLKLGDPTLAALATVIAYMANTVLTLATRARVTPNKHLPSEQVVAALLERSRAAGKK